MVIARSAARASTGLLQDKQLNPHALPVPRTRTRLLRAVLKPSARVMQATGVTQATGLSPAREHAQRVLQASTNLQQAMVIARTAARASTGWEQEDPMKHPARLVVRASTGLLQHKQLNHRARPALRGSTEWEQEDPL
jgi:hypothetical protein